MIVGEAWGKEDAEQGLPFLGPAGNTLNMLLASVGIDRKDIHLTNVFNRRPSEGSNDLSHLCGPKSEALPGYPALRQGKYVRAEFEPELTRLYSEIAQVRPNVIVAAGAAATWALLGTTGIKKVRGAPAYTAGLAASHTGQVKVLPTYSPYTVNREWKLRPIVMADLAKARREAEFPEIRRPMREFWLYPSVEDLYEFEARFFTPDQPLSIDIETAAGQITCIGFAPNPGIGIVVPFVDREKKDGNYWGTRAEEIEAWKWVKRICESYPSFGQNYLYDIHYLWRVYGIACKRAVDDTMLLHHALQPEMEKGLGFLGTVYTNEPAWKFMRTKHETLKKED